MRHAHVVWLAVMVLGLGLGLGCAEDPAGSGGGNLPGDSGTGDSAGTGAGESAAGSGSFGNTDTTIVDDGTGNVDAGARCKTGEYCPPEPEADPTGDCGSLTLETDVEVIKKPGNVLVIFDRSGSMDADWNGTPRYQSAGNALIAALTPLQELLTVGGVFFPSLDQAATTTCTCNPADFTHWIPGGCCLMGSANSCVVTTIDKPDQISFRKAADFIAELPNQWRLQGAGGTPTQGGVESAAQALMTNTFTDPVTVVLLTDGQPNCGTDQQVVLDQITAWQAAGIQTHVVGLPGSEKANTFLDQLAVAGGTTKFIDPADPAELEMRLNAVFTSTIRAGFDSCTMTLDPAADAPEKLHLVATKNGMQQDIPRDWSADATWSINSAGTKVELEGQLCKMAKDGEFEALTFKYGCVEIPEAPPPPPPE